MTLLDHITHRLDQIALLPELQQAFGQMAQYDVRRAEQGHWGPLIPELQRILGGADVPIGPFVAAWTLMYAATVRLDQLQDGDPIDDPLPTEQPGAQYNLVFGYYVLASGLLDQLSTEQIPARRILRLRRLWTDTLLRMAGGQQRDLAGVAANSLSALEHYQQLAHAKTGAAFALAFGGTAMLLSDDEALIAALISVGELYGTLIQYSDDLLDRDQPNLTMTLPTAFAQARPAHATDASGYTPAAFGGYLARVYLVQASQLLADLPMALQIGVLELFVRLYAAQADAACEVA